MITTPSFIKSFVKIILLSKILLITLKFEVLIFFNDKIKRNRVEVDIANTIFELSNTAKIMNIAKNITTLILDLGK